MKNIRLTVFSGILFSLLVSCSHSRINESAETTVVNTDNQLTEQEKADGWRLLFDGSSLNGWQIYKGRANDTWEVVDGTLHCKPLNEEVNGDGDDRADIRTTEEFENFDLAFDWKIAAEGNSGVMFRVSEEFDQPYFSGPEYQLIDDENYPGKPTEAQKTGGNYDMHVPASTKKMNPPGSWNSSRLVVNRNHVEHWLNGEKVVEYDLQSEDWIQRKNNSKWKDVASYGMVMKGYIDFQDHGNETTFKNIKIKIL